MLRGSSPDEQLREVIETFEVEVDSEVLCGRCVHCNAWDWHLVSREEVKDNPKAGVQYIRHLTERKKALAQRNVVSCHFSCFF